MAGTLGIAAKVKLMKDLALETSTTIVPAVANTLVPQVVVALAVGVTAKNPTAAVLPTNLTTHPPAKGVGEVTDQATYLPLTLYYKEAGVTPH